MAQWLRSLTGLAEDPALVLRSKDCRFWNQTAYFEHLALSFISFVTL